MITTSVYTVLTGLKVLVVDDEPDLKDLVVSEIQFHGAMVFDAAGGNEALELLKSHSFHVVISDLRMPKGDGFNLLKQIRAADPKIPVVVMMTGFSDYTEQQLLDTGAMEVLYKPFALSSLIELLSKVKANLKVS